MKIQLTNKANLKLKSFVGLVDTEISGMAKSHIDEEKNVVVTDFMIFNQEVTGASTVIDDASQAKFLNELMKAGDDPSVWNIWWHSHANMGVFWSATDDKTIEQHTSQSYLISLVTNKAGEMKARLDIYPKDNSPFKQQTYCKFDIEEIEIIETKEEFKRRVQYEKEIEKVETELEKKLELIEKKYAIKEDKTIIAYCQKEINQKVKEKVYPVSYGYNQTGFNFGKSHNYSNGWKPKKKWNWFEGITVDLDDIKHEVYSDEDDWINKQQRPIGFDYSNY